MGPKCIVSLGLAIGLGVTSFNAACADDFSGNRLKGCLEKLEGGGKDGYFEAGLGAGYVAGLHDAGDGFLWCTPKTLTLGQLASVVLKHLRDNPDKLHLSADSLAVHILKKTWPCPNRRPGADVTTPTQPPARSPRSTPRPKPKEQDVSPF